MIVTVALGAAAVSLAVGYMCGKKIANVEQAEQCEKLLHENKRQKLDEPLDELVQGGVEQGKEEKREEKIKKL